MKNPFFVVFFILLNAIPGLAQSVVPPVDTVPQGAWARREIFDGDTVYVMSLRPARIVGPRIYKDFTEQNQYNRYNRAARKVYPYAVQAIDLYNDLQDEKADMGKREYRRFKRAKRQDLKGDFSDELKNLSKTEGKVLVKMIERNLDKPFYDLIRETRGGMAATYWSGLGKIWGYDLKEGYQFGAEPLLDGVLLDYDYGDAIWRY